MWTGIQNCRNQKSRLAASVSNFLWNITLGDSDFSALFSSLSKVSLYWGNF